MTFDNGVGHLGVLGRTLQVKCLLFVEEITKVLREHLPYLLVITARHVPWRHIIHILVWTILLKIGRFPLRDTIEQLQQMTFTLSLVMLMPCFNNSQIIIPMRLVLKVLQILHQKLIRRNLKPLTSMMCFLCELCDVTAPVNNFVSFLQSFLFLSPELLLGFLSAG